jgi:hypothetical protein
VATAIAAGAVASQKAKDLEKMSMDPAKPIFDPSIQKAGKNANNVAILTGVVGAAAAVTGAVLLLTSGSSSPAHTVSVYPVVGPTLAGGGARVTF